MAFRQGSWRGVPFLWDDAPTQKGRRAALHEYPTPGLPDKPPYPEDLGRKARAFTLNVFVMESSSGADDVAAQRDALETAIETPGPGTLIHPTRGRMTVQIIGQAQIDESTSRIGIVTFSIPFVEAGNLTLTAAATGQAAVGAAQSAQAAAQANFSGQSANASAAIGATG